MPYVTSWERSGFQKGFELGFQQRSLEGLRQAIEHLLIAKVGSAGKNLLKQLQMVDDEQQLLQFLTAVVDPASTIDSLRALLSAIPA